MTVRPAQAAAGDRSAAQVDTLDMRCADEDLVCRYGQRYTTQSPRRQLECQDGSPRLVEIGAVGGQYQLQQAAQGAVLVEDRHAVGIPAERFFQLRGCGA